MRLSAALLLGFMRPSAALLLGFVRIMLHCCIHFLWLQS